MMEDTKENKEEHEEKKELHQVKRHPNKRMNFWKITTFILIILFVVSLVSGGFDFSSTKSADEVAEETLDFINTELLRGQTIATISNPEEYNDGLYRALLTISGETNYVYITKDGKVLFVNPIPVGEVEDLDVPTETPTVDVSEDDDPSKGDDDAPITIIEFSDFQCPFCGRFFTDTLPEIQEQYIDTGKVRLVYRDFPLAFHQYAQKSAEASECADEQGKFWEMHDLLYENQDEWNDVGVDKFKEYASEIGLDTEQFDDCIDSGKYEEEVLADFEDGQSAGVSGTPAFFINGKKISGAQPFSAFQEIIEEELSSN